MCAVGYWKFAPSHCMDRDVAFCSVQGQIKLLIRSFTLVLNMEMKKKGKRKRVVP
jgi:hypothetical protein